MNVQWLPHITPLTQRGISYSRRLLPVWHIVLGNTYELKQDNDDEDCGIVVCGLKKDESIFDNERGSKDISLTKNDS